MPSHEAGETEERRGNSAVHDSAFNKRDKNSVLDRQLSLAAVLAATNTASSHGFPLQRLLSPSLTSVPGLTMYPQSLSQGLLSTFEQLLPSA